MAISKGSKATALHQNLAKLLRNIVNIPDKADLVKVRDAVALANKATPNDYKNQMPL